MRFDHTIRPFVPHIQNHEMKLALYDVRRLPDGRERLGLTCFTQRSENLHWQRVRHRMWLATDRRDADIVREYKDALRYILNPERMDQEEWERRYSHLFA